MVAVSVLPFRASTPIALGAPLYAELIPGFGSYALNLQLNFTVANHEDQYPGQHELRNRMLARFRWEGIAIPYPRRDVGLVSEFKGGRPISKSA